MEHERLNAQPFRVLVIDDEVAKGWTGNPRTPDSSKWTPARLVQELCLINPSVQVFLTGSLAFPANPLGGGEKLWRVTERGSQVCNSQFLSTDDQARRFLRDVHVLVLDIMGVGTPRAALAEAAQFRPDEQPAIAELGTDHEGAAFYRSHRRGLLVGCRAVAIFTVLDDPRSGAAAPSPVHRHIDPYCRDLAHEFGGPEGMDGPEGPWTFKCDSRSGRDLQRLLGIARSQYDDHVEGFVSLRGAGAIEFAASRDAPVLIVGESGTGKERLARRIANRWQSQRDPPGEASFHAINCSGLGEQLARSELFGHVRGAYTGADTHRLGKILSAFGVRGREGVEKLRGNVHSDDGESRWAVVHAVLQGIAKLHQSPTLADVLTAVGGSSAGGRTVAQALKAGSKRGDVAESALALASYVTPHAVDRPTWEIVTQGLRALVEALKRSDQPGALGSVATLKSLDLAGLATRVQRECDRVSKACTSLEGGRSAERDPAEEFRLLLLASGLFRSAGYWDLEAIGPSVVRATLFLDEFGDLAGRVQAMLLRYLQDGEIEPLGYEGVVRGVRLRIVCATSDPWVARVAGVELAGRPGLVPHTENALRTDLVFRVMGQVIRAPSITMENAEREVRALVQGLGMAGSFGHVDRSGVSPRLGEPAISALAELVRGRLVAPANRDAPRAMFGQYREVRAFLDRLRDYLRTAHDRGVRERLTNTRGEVTPEVVRRLWGPALAAPRETGPSGERWTFDRFVSEGVVEATRKEGQALEAALTSFGTKVTSPAFDTHTLSRLRKKVNARSADSGVKLLASGLHAVPSET